MDAGFVFSRVPAVLEVNCYSSAEILLTRVVNIVEINFYLLKDLQKMSYFNVIFSHSAQS